MAYSYKWLQSYFTETLPSPQEVEQGIIFHSFEVEGIEQRGDDTLLEIKILPDRAHDCLCHMGIAGEIKAIFDLPMRPFPSDYGSEIKTDFGGAKPARELGITIACPDLCRRYIGRRIENITVGPSPDWLKTRLENIGQRSISNIVDATNYVMFDLGQPLHAFDADKVKGNITVRRAQDGEKMTTLDGKELCLTADNMVIADDEGILALAGIKGGNRAEVDGKTKNIILEAANFDPVSVRRTSQAVGIRTDASKRFENELSPEVAEEAMERLTALIYALAGEEQLAVGEMIDEYPKPAAVRLISLAPSQTNGLLGIDIPKAEQEAILRRVGIEIETAADGWRLKMPARRVDLEIKENVIEEIGRIYGYDKIPPRVLENKIERSEEKPANKNYRVANKIREVLLASGFSEVYGYAFAAKGEIEVANPLALDRPFLRMNLTDWLLEKTAFNLLHILFDHKPVKIFEIGRVFKKQPDGIDEQPHLALALGKRGVKPKIGDELKAIMSEAVAALNAAGLPAASEIVLASDNAKNITLATLEIPFGPLAEKADLKSEPNLDPFIAPAGEYKRISPFPRVIRDVAVWVPETVTDGEVEETIKTAAGDLLAAGPVLFDRFAKDGRISLAFRQVFQSFDRTLSDAEVNAQMDKVIAALEGKGWEVRK